METPKTPKWLSIFVLVILSVVYFNVGYQYSAIAQEISNKKSADTFVENVISGGWMFTNGKHNSTFDHLILLFAWILILVISIMSWIGVFLWEFILCFWEGVRFLYWLIFCGGLHEIAGTSGIIGIIIAVIGIISWWKLSKIWKRLPNEK